MLLAIDIGNTNIALGLYDGERPGPRWRLASDQARMPDEYGITLVQLLRHAGLEASAVDAVAMASVVPPLTSALEQACRAYLGRSPWLVDPGTRTGVRVRYEDPRQVGADRVVDAAAVLHLYGGPACIVDFSTATTFDAVTADGEYLGGAIAPGIGIAAEALFQSAAKLPKVELRRPPSAIGRNTVHSIQSGLLYGYVGLVEGMVARFAAELGPKMKVVGTGWLVEIIAAETAAIQVVAPWLTLDGLRIVYAMNAGRDTGRRNRPRPR